MGHSKIPIKTMIANVSKMVLEKIDNLDFLFIAGDFWDKALNLPAIEVLDIFVFIRDLLLLCKEKDIRLRVLEGTPSHDREQSKYFKYVNDTLADKKADLRYYSTLTIDYEEDFDINILYVPDEWKGCTEKAWDDVQAALAERNLSQVDFSIMHGMFGYQMPKGLNLPVHKEERYLSITKRYVFIGHVHTFSTHEHIIAQGSTDRLQHGEEEDKGCVYVESTGDHSKDKITRIINDGAVKFVTLDVSQMKSDDIMGYVQDYVVNELDGKFCFLRLLIADNEIHRGIYISLKSFYPDINWDFKLPKKKKVVAEKKSLAIRIPVINKSTIHSLLEGKLREEHGEVDADVIAELNYIIKGADNGCESRL